MRHLNFTLRPGERIALVGENGAGKTTITKLLARLYDPTEGRILLDGRDLREYDVASVRRAISVIFQDFVRYDFRFDENIGVGEIELAKPYLWQPPAAESAHAELAHAELAQSKLVHAAVAATEPTNGNPISDAARKTLADTLLPRFGDGYGQMLGRRFKDGVELSGGEWQKVALARSYMRQSQALILDEPTAALDARAEYEVFLRFSELVAGRSADHQPKKRPPLWSYGAIRKLMLLWPQGVGILPHHSCTFWISNTWPARPNLSPVTAIQRPS